MYLIALKISTFRNIRENLSFLIPAIIDEKFSKCQLFCVTRYATDIITAWIKDQLKKLQTLVPSSILIEKLTGDNTRAEKERVMELFRGNSKMVLVCTDVAGMGLDVQDLNFAINIGIPKNSWKIQQQTGRIGRSGERSVSITLAYSQKGKLAPEPVLRDVFKQEGCIRRKINDLFTLTDPLKDYSAVSEDVICSEVCRELEQNCDCSMCRCCSNCSSLCPCSNKDDNETLENILGFGDENYRLVQYKFVWSY